MIGHAEPPDGVRHVSATQHQPHRDRSTSIVSRLASPHVLERSHLDFVRAKAGGGPSQFAGSVVARRPPARSKVRVSYPAFGATLRRWWRCELWGGLPGDTCRPARRDRHRMMSGIKELRRLVGSSWRWCTCTAPTVFERRLLISGVVVTHVESLATVVGHDHRQEVERNSVTSTRGS
jgi:hypothetical protein